MNALALSMFRADFLKLRRRRGTIGWALFLAFAPILIFFIVKAVQHSSDAVKYEPAGGEPAFRDALRILALFFGPLAAILIGVEAGTGDLSAGVFRDLVVTGRSRLALFASRAPAAVAVSWCVCGASYLLALVGVYAFASNLATPSLSEVLNGAGFMLLGTGVVSVVAVGFSSLVASKPASITALIGWQLVASPIIVQISSLGSAREGLLSQAIAHFSPVSPGGGGHGATVSLSQGTAIVVLLAWVLASLALGAWRTRRIDA